MQMLLLTALCACMVIAIYQDTRYYRLPNWLNSLLLLLFIPHAFLHLPLEALPWHLLSFAVFFIAGMGIFSLKLLGGGDIKMLAVLGLWTGWGLASVDLLIYTGLLGGALAIILVIARKFLPFIQAKVGRAFRLPALLIEGQPVPYGIAIAIAFTIVLLQGKVPGLAA